MREALKSLSRAHYASLGLCGVVFGAMTFGGSPMIRGLAIVLITPVAILAIATSPD